MRRVLHVTPYMDASAGGPPVVVEHLVAGSGAHGYRADILSTPALTTDNGAALRAAYPGIALIPRQMAAIGPQGFAEIARHIAQADIVHLHTMWSPLVAAAARAAVKQKVPFVIAPHGMLDPYSIGQKSWKKWAYFRLIEGRTLRAAARVVFTAEDEKRLAAPMTGAVASAIIALGAEAAPASRDILATEFHAQHPELAERPLVTFLGRFHEKKRPEAVLDALAVIVQMRPDVMLLFAGSGPEEAKLRAKVKDLNLTDHVTFMGFLSGRDKWRALSAARVFLLPSQQENFGIALAEALHAGVPALITEHVNIWREIVAAGAGATVSDVGLVDDLAAKTCDLLADQDAWQVASDAARDLAVSAFGWPASVQRTCALYDSILDERPASSANTTT